MSQGPRCLRMSRASRAILRTRCRAATSSITSHPNSGDRPLGLARRCGLDNTSSSLDVAHSASQTLFRSGRVRGTTSWYCSSSNSHALGDPAALSKHTVSAVTAPLVKSSCHGLSVNTFSQGKLRRLTTMTAGTYLMALN